jgi:hypothetical protein
VRRGPAIRRQAERGRLAAPNTSRGGSGTRLVLWRAARFDGIIEGSRAIFPANFVARYRQTLTYLARSFGKIHAVNAGPNHRPVSVRWPLAPRAPERQESAPCRRLGAHACALACYNPANRDRFKPNLISIRSASERDTSGRRLAHSSTSAIRAGGARNASIGSLPVAGRPRFWVIPYCLVFFPP